MNFGIPFRSPFGRPFGVPFSNLVGGIPEPSGFTARYTSYLAENFLFGTGSQVQTWKDETTQTFGSESVTNGDFSGGDTDWNYNPAYIDISGGKCSWDGTASSNLSQTAVVDIGTEYIITFEVSDMTTGLLLFRNPSSTTSLSVSANGSYSHIYSALDNDVTFRGSSGFDGSIDNISVKEVLTGANDLTQNTSANQPVLTQDANRFNNTVDFGTDDFMEGLPSQTGDFTYVFKGLNLPTDTGSSRVFLSNPSEANSLFYVVGASDKFAIRDQTNAINEFNKIIDYGVDQTVVLTRSGNLFSLYVDGVFQDSITISVGLTGFTAVGRANPSFDGSLQELYVYDRALTQDEINWFSYLRDENNNILLPPLLPSAKYAVNSANLNGSNQYFNGGDINDVTGTFSISGYFKTSNVSGSRRIVDKTTGANGTGYNLYLNSSGELRLGRYEDSSNYLNYTTASSDYSDGEWYRFDISAGINDVPTLYVNGVEVTMTLSSQLGTVTTISNSAVYLVGSRSDGTDRFDGELAFIAFSDTTDMTQYIDDVTSGGNQKCFSDIDTGIASNYSSFHNLSNFNGNDGTETDDQTNNGNNLTNIGSTTYTGTGLTVECST